MAAIGFYHGGASNASRSMAQKTTVEVHETTADDLHALKRRGDSYDDVIRRLLERHRSQDKGQEKTEDVIA